VVIRLVKVEKVVAPFWLCRQPNIFLRMMGSRMVCSARLLVGSIFG
jgi:hypothetical protein